MNGEVGRGMDLKVEFVVPFGDEDDRSRTTAALVLTLAFGRKAGSDIMDDEGLALYGDWGREGGAVWKVMTLLKLTLAVTLRRCEWQVECIECQYDNYLAFVHERCLKSTTVVVR